MSGVHWAWQQWQCQGTRGRTSCPCQQHTQPLLETSPEVTCTPQNWGNSACCLSFPRIKERENYFLDRAWVDLASLQVLEGTGTDQNILSHNNPLSLDSGFHTVTEKKKTQTVSKIPFSNKINVWAYKNFLYSQIRKEINRRKMFPCLVSLHFWSLLCHPLPNLEGAKRERRGGEKSRWDAAQLFPFWFSNPSHPVFT